MSKIAAGFSKNRTPDIVEKLTEQLSFSELNSLLLEIYKKAAQQINPAELQKNYEQNRFVSASEYDPIAFRDLKLHYWSSQKNRVCSDGIIAGDPLGTCSVIGTVDQNKIISAARGTKSWLMQTNVLALESAKERKQKHFDNANPAILFHS